MPIYRVRGPDGKIYRVNGPEGATPEQVISVVQANLAQQKGPEGGIIGAAKRGAESLVSSGQTALESIFGDEEEAVRAGMQRQEEIARKYEEPASLERVKQAYAERGVLGGAGEVASQVAPTISEQVPQLAAMAASARAGAMAGARIPGAGLIGAPVGAVVGAVAPSFIQQYGSNLERQAQEQIARGEEVDVSRLKAAAAAVPQAALDVASTAVVLGKTLIGKLLGETFESAMKKRGIEATEKLAKEKLITSIGKGTATGAVAEIPTEIAQQMLERTQAGLSLTSDDALQEYGNTAYQVGLLAPLGGLGRVAERAGAKSEVETRRAIEEAERAAPPPAPPAPEGGPSSPAPPAPPAAPTPAPEGEPVAEPPAPPKFTEQEQKAIDFIRSTKQHSAIGLAGHLNITPAEAGTIRQKLVDEGELYKVVENGRTSWKVRSTVEPEKLNVAMQYLQDTSPARNSALDIVRAFKNAGTPVTIEEAAAIRNELLTQKLLYRDRNDKWKIRVPKPVTPAAPEPVAGPTPAGARLPVPPEPAGRPPVAEPVPAGMGDTGRAPPVVAQGAPDGATALEPPPAARPEEVTPPAPVEASPPAAPVEVPPVTPAPTPEEVTPPAPQVAPPVSTPQDPIAPTSNPASLPPPVAAPVEAPLPVEAPAPVEPVKAPAAPRKRTKVAAPATPQPAPIIGEAIIGEDEVHPQWATNVADFNGPLNKVAYSSRDKDVALIRSIGPDVEIGRYKVLYKVAKHDSLWISPKDVRETTARHFGITKKQHDELLAAADKLSNEESRLSDLYPRGPFSKLKSQENVLVADNVDPKYADYLKRLNKLVPLNGTNIFFFDIKDLSKYREKYGLYGRLVSLLWHSQREEVDGFTNEIGGVRYIAFRQSDNPAKDIETIAHEYGHAIEYELLNRASVTTRIAIRKEYEAWLARVKNLNTEDFVNELRSRERAGKLIASVPFIVRTAPAVQTTNFDNYWSTFSEWFADQVARWATTSEKPVSLVDKFFADVARVMRRFAALVTGKQFLPNSEVKKFLDGIAAVNSSDSLQFLANEVDPVTRSYTVEDPPATKENFDGIKESINSFPQINSTPVEEFVRSVSGTQGPMLRAFYGFLSMTQIGELFRSVMPSIEKLVEITERRSSDMLKRRDAINKNYLKWQKIVNHYKSIAPQFFKIVGESTRQQIDVTSDNSRQLVNDVNSGRTPYTQLTPFRQQQYDLTTQYQALPRALQTVYNELRTEYQAQSDELLETMRQTVTDANLFEQIKNEFLQRRLGVYFPLYRSGEYWMSYTDRTGEPVVLAFDSERERMQAVNSLSPAERQTVIPYVRMSKVTTKAIPPAGFLKQVVENLRANAVPEATIDAIYELYLNYLPAESIRQQFRARQGFLGYDQDALKVYSIMAPRIANQLNNMKYAGAIDSTVSDIEKERLENAPNSMAAAMAAENIKSQVEFIQNPPPRGVFDQASYFSYLWYILGNVSSALVNVSQMPIVVYPMLGGKYGFDRAFKVWGSSIAEYWKGGKEDRADALSDWTFAARPNLDPELRALFEEAVDRSVVRRSTGQELAEARVTDTTTFTGKRARVEHGLGWIFQNSERANREVSLLMAYKLARQGGNGNTPKSPEEARRIAIEMVNAAHGSALAETGPRLFQTGLGKLMFVFKRFAQSQIYLLSKLFRQAFGPGTPKDVRKMAARQLGGIFTMSFMVAGAQGMPLYGAAALLASMLEDEDEPLDWDQQVTQWLGMIGYKGPVSYALQADIASRTGFNGLLWRDDAPRMAEIGPLLYAVEVAGGPAYGVLRSWERALGHFEEGRYDRAAEAATPAFIRNGLKSLRLAEEGARTTKGVPIVEDFSARQVFMQTFGFNPIALAEKNQLASTISWADKQLAKRRESLLNRFDAARMSQDQEGMREILAEIVEFNKKNLDSAYVIKRDTLTKSYQERRRREQNTVAGIYLPEKNRKFLMEKYGWEDDPADVEEEQSEE